MGAPTPPPVHLTKAAPANEARTRESAASVDLGQVSQGLSRRAADAHQQLDAVAGEPPLPSSSPPWSSSRSAPARAADADAAARAAPAAHLLRAVVTAA